MSNFSFKTIDVPAAAGTYTYIGVTGVDASGDAVGYYGNVDGDGDGTFHGFIALVNGNGIPLDPPGSTNTSVGMTASGVIFGDYTYLNHQYGFVDNGGVFTTFDYGIAEAAPPSVPIAVSTDVDGITNAGVVYGDYADYVINNDNQPGWQGFLNNNGVVTLVSFPGANVTTLADINSSGTIVGNYEFGGNTNAGWIGHGFVDHNGSFTSIDVPGAYSTSVVGISDGGVIAGNYQDNASNEFGFVDNNGVFTTINIPGGTNVLVNAINATGEIVGDYLGADNKVHGYTDNNGVITTVDVPGSTFTEIDGINANGQIFGSYDDSMGNQHGFVGSPLPATTIESFGATSLTQVGNDYFLYANGTTNGPELTYSGTPWAAGQAWAPIGVEKTSSGYEVALFNASSHLYTVWNTDGSGNVLSASIAGVSGTDTALESIETSFQQDLNGDGTIGIPVASGTIEAFGATKLVQVGNDYFFNPVAGGSGPELMYGGTPWAAGQAWAPIGVEKTSTGYEVALLNASTHLYTIWNTDSSGNVLGGFARQCVRHQRGAGIGRGELPAGSERRRRHRRAERSSRQFNDHRSLRFYGAGSDRQRLLLQSDRGRFGTRADVQRHAVGGRSGLGADRRGADVDRLRGGVVQRIQPALHGVEHRQQRQRAFGFDRRCVRHQHRAGIDRDQLLPGSERRRRDRFGSHGDRGEGPRRAELECNDPAGIDRCRRHPRTDRRRFRGR